jgi:hypothetical protein
MAPSQPQSINYRILIITAERLEEITNHKQPVLLISPGEQYK